jgi:hypothetical protein
MLVCFLLSLTDRNFFQSGIFLPSMTWLENEASPVLSLPDFDPSLTTYIRENMVLVQCMDAKKHRIFGDLAIDYCRQLTLCFAKAHTVADVFERFVSM